jgi:hypothetical protein
VLEAELAGRIRRVETGVAPQDRRRPTAAPPAVRETLKVPRPDFNLIFRDYVYFWIGPVGHPSSEIAVGRRYRDVFFDLQRFSGSGSAWGPKEAIEQFLRGKIQTNFVPRSLSHEALPEGAGEVVPLTVERLDAAFAQIV